MRCEALGEFQAREIPDLVFRFWRITLNAPWNTGCRWARMDAGVQPEALAPAQERDDCILGQRWKSWEEKITALQWRWEHEELMASLMCACEEERNKEDSQDHGLSDWRRGNPLTIRKWWEQTKRQGVVGRLSGGPSWVSSRNDVTLPLNLPLASLLSHNILPVT